MIETYHTHEEMERYQFCSDVEINGLLKELAELQDGIWFIREFQCTTKRIFRKPVYSVRYSLYKKTSDGVAQCINFAQDHEWSINTMVSKPYILTYLFGMLAGLKLKRK